MCFDARKTKHSLVRRLLNIARAKTTSSPFLLGSGADTVHLTRHTRHQREFTVTACRQSHSLRTHTHAKPNTLGVVGWEVEKTSPDNEHTKITVKKKKKKNTGCKKQHQQQQQTLHKTCIFHSSLLQSSFGLLSFFLLTSASFLSEQTNSTETLGGEEKKKTGRAAGNPRRLSGRFAYGVKLSSLSKAHLDLAFQQQKRERKSTRAPPLA